METKVSKYRQYMDKKDKEKRLYPLGIYTDYLGKPLYQYARKAGIPEIGAIAAAQIPGTLLHISPALIGENWELAGAAFLASEIIFTGIFYAMHQNYRKKRLETRNRNLDSIIIE